MLRFILIVILFLASLLCIFKAPVYPLWFVAILVEEFPWIFFGIEGLLLIWGIRSQRFQISGNIIAAISFLIFLKPVIRAYLVARHLPSDLTQSFKLTESPAASPFRFLTMINGFHATPIPHKRLVYSRKDNILLSLDFYPAQLPGSRPVVMVIHGGSWAGGDSQQLPELNSVLAKKGYNVASINYRLAPKFESPAPIEDVSAALHYLREHALDLNVDAEQIVLLGRSAGAQIALTAAYSLKDPSVKGVIAFYGPADMVWGYSQPSNPLIMDSRKVMEDYLGGPYRVVPEKYRQSSAIGFVTPTSVPTLLIHGQNDVLVFYEHSIRLAKKLKENDVEHYLLTLPWATHGCDFTLTGPGGQLSTYSILIYLEHIFKSERLLEGTK